MNERDRALHLLQRIERESLYASLALANESGFIRTVVLGVLRWRSRLDYEIAALAGRRLGKLDPVVVDILRIGLFQLRFMDVAPYAAVSESVDLARSRANRARGFVNAILREATRRTPELPDDATRFSHPQWLYERWVRMYGSERAAAIADANQQLSFPDALIIAGDPPEGSTPSAFVEGIVRLTGSTAELDRSRIWPMDEGSAVVAAIAAAAGHEVLDMAAAPGGKTLYMRTRGAAVTSSDVSISRLLPLAHRSARVLVSDGRRPALGRRFQTVLLDAPCSATGTIRKSPELKWRLAESDLPSFAALQRQLLASALDLAAETCVYSTCSLEPEENDAVVADVLQSVSGFERVDVTAYAPPAVRPWISDGILRLTPESGADGFTVFVMRRSM